MDGRMDGWTDGWIDGWMDGWMDHYINYVVFIWFVSWAFSNSVPVSWETCLTSQHGGPFLTSQHGGPFSDVTTWRLSDVTISDVTTFNANVLILAPSASSPLITFQIPIIWKWQEKREHSALHLVKENQPLTSTFFNSVENKFFMIIWENFRRHFRGVLTFLPTKINLTIILPPMVTNDSLSKDYLHPNKYNFSANFRKTHFIVVDKPRG